MLDEARLACSDEPLRLGGGRIARLSSLSLSSSAIEDERGRLIALCVPSEAGSVSSGVTDASGASKCAKFVLDDEDDPVVLL